MNVTMAVCMEMGAGVPWRLSNIARGGGLFGDIQHASLLDLNMTFC